MQQRRSVVYVKDDFGRDIQKVVDYSDERDRSRDRSSSFSRDRSDSYDSEYSSDREDRYDSYHHHHSDRHHHSSHRNPLDSSKRTVPHIPLANTGPRRTFYQFMYYHKNNNITPQQAREEFTKEMEKYDVEVVQRLFHAFCMEEWMEEQYHPSRIIEYRENLLKEIRQQHALYSKLVAMKEIIKPSSSPSSLSMTDYSSPIIDDIYPDCLMIDNLPSSCSKQEFKNHLQNIKGIRSIYFGHPLLCPAQGLNYFVWISCENKESCEEIINLFKNKFEYISNDISKSVKKIDLNCQYQPSFRKQYYLPSLLNQPEYIDEDLENLLKLLHALENYYMFDISFKSSLEILCSENPSITKIDQVYILSFFIRRVFGYDYWRNKKDDSFGISFNKYSIDMVRNQGINEETSEKDKEWIQNHRENFNAFYESIQNKQFSVQLEGELLEDYKRELDLKEDLDELYKPFVREVDGQQQCTFCDKLFDTHENMYNHLNQKHYEKIEKGMKKYLENVYYHIYERDKEKIIPIIIDTKKSQYRY